MTLKADLGRPAPIDITVSVSPPVGTKTPASGQCRITILEGEQTARSTFFLKPGVAGHQRFDPATIMMKTDLFESTSRSGSTPLLVVQPRRPRGIHVGASGKSTTSSFVDSTSDMRSIGLTPTGVRQYIIGDTVSRIDWKTTARLRQPHVVEFEAETDIRMTLVVDHRATMGLGPEGEQKLDYARQVALTSLEGARQTHEPVGLICVGDYGLTVNQAFGSTPAHYTMLRTRLHDLAPTEETTPDATENKNRRPSKARQMAKRLQGDDSTFAVHVSPFLSKADQYIKRLGEDPLYATVRAVLKGDQAADVVVFLTDDEHRTEILEAVRAARKGDNRVVVFLLPTVLFEPAGLIDLNEAYERYVDFDGFRHDLASLEGVSAYEVGPRDRIEALGIRLQRQVQA